MRLSLRHGAGYLVIDHKDSPGLTPADVAHVPGAVATGGGQVLERDILQCSHCQRGVLLHPLRTRDRGFCPKCNRYVCDQCETRRIKTGECVPFKAIIDRLHDVVEKNVNPKESKQCDLQQ